MIDNSLVCFINLNIIWIRANMMKYVSLLSAIVYRFQYYWIASGRDISRGLVIQRR